MHSSHSSLPAPDLDPFCEPIVKNVLMSDLGPVVVFALLHFQSGLHAFMLYQLFRLCLSACIALVSLFVSL